MRNAWTQGNESKDKATEAPAGVTTDAQGPEGDHAQGGVHQAKDEGKFKFRAGAEVRSKLKGKSTTFKIESMEFDADDEVPVYHGKVTSKGATKGASITAREDEIEAM